MERLKAWQDRGGCPSYPYLHSSMERLKDIVIVLDVPKRRNLHSSMERLKVIGNVYNPSAVPIFTFQYGEIKRNPMFPATDSRRPFTFQYGEIKSDYRCRLCYHNRDLHSSMERLKAAADNVA